MERQVSGSRQRYCMQRSGDWGVTLACWSNLWPLGAVGVHRDNAHRLSTLRKFLGPFFVYGLPSCCSSGSFSTLEMLVNAFLRVRASGRATPP